jgi:formylglycine-generating enzyme required for sulfatase activity
MGLSHPVGTKPPNAWGFHDLHGNVWEWCSDWYAPYSGEAVTDPTGPSAGTDKVFRGGSWFDFHPAHRSANRHRHRPDQRYTAIGFRLVLEPASLRADRVVQLPDGAELAFLRVRAGSYERGSPAEEVGRAADEGPRHRVTLSRDFYLGQTEVTQAQWQAIMRGNPSVFQDGPDAAQRPVEWISWNDSQAFLAALNALGLGRFRLPTEAEWEYAARGGTSTRFPWGEDSSYRELAANGWGNPRSEGRTHRVATRRANPWGFFDLAGNVWEWCSDWKGPYAAGEQTDPVGPHAGTARVIRGGSWFNEPEALRSANRHGHPPDSRQTNLGLRLVLEPEE